MRKNILQSEVKQELISRIEKLTPTAQKQWGKMNVNQMLRHNSMGIQQAYGDLIPNKKVNWFTKKLMRFFILHSDMATPKEKADTFMEMNMVELNINPADFEGEKKKLMEEIKNFPNRKLSPESVMLGAMSTENWARLQYTHIHHHILQFGV